MLRPRLTVSSGTYPEAKFSALIAPYVEIVEIRTARSMTVQTRRTPGLVVLRGEDGDTSDVQQRRRPIETWQLLVVQEYRWEVVASR